MKRFSKVLSLALVLCAFVFSKKATYASTEQVNQIVAFAESKLGSTAYSGYCQSFVKSCYESAGIYASANPGTATEAKNKWMISTDLSNIPVGACVYYNVNHVTLYIGNGYVIDGSDGGKVTKHQIDRTSYFWNASTKAYDIPCYAVGWGYQAGYDLYSNTTITPTTPTYSKPFINGATYIIRSAYSGKALEVPSGTSSKVDLQVWSYAGDQWQTWICEEIPEGYRFINAFTKQAIDIKNNSTASGAQLIQFPKDTTTPVQKYKIIDAGGGKYGIISVHNGLAVDLYGASTENGCKVKLCNWHGGDNQLWTFELLDSVKPTISNVQVTDVTSSGYRVSCTITDDLGVAKVQFPTWTDNNGQDDLIWHDGIKSGDTYYYDVKISEHNSERGKYNTHIYAWDYANNASYEVTNVDVLEDKKTILDLNGFLDSIDYSLLNANEEGNDLGSFGTADVYVNGTKVADDVNDFYQTYPEGTSYEITDIKGVGKVNFDKVLSGNLKGNLSGSRVNVWLLFKTDNSGSSNGGGSNGGGSNGGSGNGGSSNGGSSNGGSSNGGNQGTPQIDDFVTRCYSLALNRKPDQNGFNDWRGYLVNGEMVGSTVVYNFIFSPEYLGQNKKNEEFVNDLYTMFLGRPADQSGYDSWCGLMKQGWSREDVFAGFANSTEFNKLCNNSGISAGYYTNRYSMNQVNSVNLFVERLYKTCLGRRGDIEGQKTWVEGMLNGKYTGVGCAVNFIKSQEYLNKGLTDEQYVENLYIGFMGRTSDAAGKASWMQLLSSGEMTRDQVFEGFANSVEFGNICAGYGIERGSYKATDVAH